jgi:hypothetical protein
VSRGCLPSSLCENILLFSEGALNQFAVVSSKLQKSTNREFMKTKSIWNRAMSMFLSSLVSLSLTALVSCSNDENEPDFSSDDKESVTVDTNEDFYYEDADDMASEAFELEDEGGRMSTDERLACAERTRTGTKENGTLRIDFGDGCTGPHGNVRKGAIEISHTGAWKEVGSQWTITFDDYYFNDIHIEGTRTVSVTVSTDSLMTYEIVLAGGKLTWPNGKFATREAHHTRKHERHEDNLLDRLIISGNASGTLRNGNGYTIEIIEPLVFSRACDDDGIFIPVSGVKLIKHGNREITIDYGDGTCDNVATLTNKSGRTTTFEVKK